MVRVKPHVFGPHIEEAKEYIMDANDKLGAASSYKPRGELSRILKNAHSDLPNEGGSHNPIQDVEEAFTRLEQAHDIAEQNTHDDDIQNAYGDVRMAYEEIHKALNEGVRDNDEGDEGEEVEASAEEVTTLRERVMGFL